LIIASSPSFTNGPALTKGATYDPLKDFVPIGLLATQAMLLTVNASLPPNTLAEFIAYAKANPGKLNYGSPGIGTPHHLGMEQFKAMAGIDMVNIVYRGGGPLMHDVLAGAVPVTFGSWVIVGTHVSSGKLKALAASSKRPMTQAPHVPPIATLGYPDFDVEAWFGLAAPAGTPRGVLERLNREVQAIQSREDVRQRMLTVGFDPPPPDSVAQFWERLQRDTARWGKVITAIGLTPN